MAEHDWVFKLELDLLGVDICEHVSRFDLADWHHCPIVRDETSVLCWNDTRNRYCLEWIRLSLSFVKILY